MRLTFPATTKSPLAQVAGYGVALGGLALWGAYQLLRAQPLRTPLPTHPAKTYQEALKKIQKLSDSKAQLNALCQPVLLSHGRQTERAIAFIHGYTNCPHQFSQLAPLFFQLGYNVYIARLPKHGLADRFSPLQGDLTSLQLAQSTNQVVDILCGLGQQTTLFGFSLGGVLAGWAAQNRPELDHAVLVSPAFAVQGVPLGRRQLYANLFNLLPNFFQWWDPAVKEKRVGPLHAYPRWSTHGIGSMLRLSGLVEEAAGKSRPVAKKITVIINPDDEAVNNLGADRIVERWRQQGMPVEYHAFAAEWKLIHDLIDPDQPEAQIDKVYPQLLAWLT